MIPAPAADVAAKKSVKNKNACFQQRQLPFAKHILDKAARSSGIKVKSKKPKVCTSDWVRDQYKQLWTTDDEEDPERLLAGMRCIHCNTVSSGSCVTRMQAHLLNKKVCSASER